MLENQKDINGNKITCNEWNVAKGQKWLHRLQRVLGPALGSMLNEATLSKAFVELNNQLSESDYLAWTEDLLEGVTVNGQPVTKDSLNIIFKGKLLFMHKVMLFVLEVNFRDFLEEFKGKNTLENLQKKMTNQIRQG